MAVYFAQSEDGGPVKIGFATNVGVRVKTLQMASPSKLMVVRQIDGDVAVERWLHRHFKKYRLSGEWFSFCDEMLTVAPPTIVKPKRKPKEQELLDALSAALSKRAEMFGGVSLFRKALAQKMGVSGTTVANWIYGQVLPNGVCYLWLLHYFGAAFENEVRGENSKYFDWHEELDQLRALAEKLRKMADEADPQQTGFAELREVLADARKGLHETRGVRLKAGQA